MQKAVEQVITLRDAVKIREGQLKKAEDAALDAMDAEDADEIQFKKADVKKAKKALADTKSKLKNKEQALGVKEKARLAKVAASPYYDLRMKGRALKHRLRDRLRSRKFELDRVERSVRHRMQATGTAILYVVACLLD